MENSMFFTKKLQEKECLFPKNCKRKGTVSETVLTHPRTKIRQVTPPGSGGFRGGAHRPHVRPTAQSHAHFVGLFKSFKTSPSLSKRFKSYRLLKFSTQKPPEIPIFILLGPLDPPLPGMSHHTSFFPSLVNGGNYCASGSATESSLEHLWRDSSPEEQHTPNTR